MGRGLREPNVAFRFRDPRIHKLPHFSPRATFAADEEDHGGRAEKP